MNQGYFTDEEWNHLLQAPNQAIRAVVLADKTDPISFLKEAKAAMQILVEEQQRTDVTTDVVKALLDGLQAADANESLSGEALILQKEFRMLGELQELNSVSDGQKQAQEHLKQVASILAAKVSIVQADEFKDWLLTLARRVAEAVREAGFLKIGGERVTNEELKSLERLEQALDFRRVKR
jgi:ABC-type branched-subunit amino acid transport system substrate-binding protein